MELTSARQVCENVDLVLAVIRLWLLFAAFVRCICAEKMALLACKVCYQLVMRTCGSINPGLWDRIARKRNIWARLWRPTKRFIPFEVAQNGREI